MKYHSFPSYKLFPFITSPNRMSIPFHNAGFQFLSSLAKFIIQATYSSKGLCIGTNAGSARELNNNLTTWRIHSTVKNHHALMVFGTEMRSGKIGDAKERFKQDQI